MEDNDNKKNTVDVDDEKLPTVRVTSTKKRYFAKPQDAKTEKDELWDAVLDIADTYKEQFKAADKKDKIIILAIILPLAVLLVMGAFGVFFANFGQALGLRPLEVTGFVIMGVGLGGFFLYIVGILIWNRFR